MKARKSGTNDQWKEIKYIQLEDSDILYKSEVMEFDAPLSESELYEQWGLESPLQDYWQDIRERAAIAEMQVAWSEEDDAYLTECINAIATKDGWSFEEKRKTKHWHKSLKQRIER